MDQQRTITYSARFPRELADIVQQYTDTAGISKSQLIIDGTMREIELRRKHTTSTDADTEAVL